MPSRRAATSPRAAASPPRWPPAARRRRPASPLSRPRPAARRSSPSRSATPASPPRPRPRRRPAPRSSRPPRRPPRPLRPPRRRRPSRPPPTPPRPPPKADPPPSPAAAPPGAPLTPHRPNPRSPPMSFTAKDVQRLRQATRAGMMDAKRALEETGGDFDAAAKVLREKGLAKSASRADRENTQGAVAVRATDTAAAIVELKCETDFVAKSEEFLAVLDQLLETVLAGRSGDEPAAN